jgi:hypothetical protein
VLSPHHRGDVSSTVRKLKISDMASRDSEERSEESVMGEMKMAPMSISVSGGLKKPSTSIDGVILRQRRGGGAMIVLVTAVFAIFFILAYMSSPASQVDSLDTIVVERPERIDQLLDLATARGLQTNALVPILKSESEVITQASFPVC